MHGSSPTGTQHLICLCISLAVKRVGTGEDTQENGKIYCVSIFVPNLLGMRCLHIHVLSADGSGMQAGQGSSSKMSAPAAVPDGSSRGCAITIVLQARMRLVLCTCFQLSLAHVTGACHSPEAGPFSLPLNLLLRSDLNQFGFKTPYSCLNCVKV